MYGVAQIMISTDISDDSVVHFLRTVGPILDFQLDLQRCARGPLTLTLVSVARHVCVIVAASSLRRIIVACIVVSRHV